MNDNGLARFVPDHRQDYPRALEEIRRGRKQPHWIWYIFPQMVGLGFSGYSTYYGIRDLAEAKAFLADGYLGGSLREITRALLTAPGERLEEIAPSPDDKKIVSSMTLFAAASACEEDRQLFLAVLDRFGKKQDPRTLAILRRQAGEEAR